MSKNICLETYGQGAMKNARSNFSSIDIQQTFSLMKYLTILKYMNFFVSNNECIQLFLIIYICIYIYI